MIYCVGVGCGIANYFLYRICMNDLQMGKKTGLHKAAILIIIFLASLAFSVLFDFYGYGILKIIKYCLLMNGLVVIAYEDVREKRIPNRWLVYLISIRAALLAVEAVLYPFALIDNLEFTLFGCLASFIILFMSYVISRHGIGLGDVKLFTVIGLYLGMSSTYFVILLSLIIAAVYGVVKLLGKRLKVKDEIAFGPFAAIGTIIILGLGF